MKKHSFLVLAGGLLAFAACNNPSANTGASQAQIDSMVNARVEAIRAEMTASNDSMINAMAQIKADSMMAAMKPGTTITTSTNTTRTVKTPKPTPKPVEPPKQGGLKGHSDQSNTNSGGLKSHSDQNATQGKSGGGLKSHSDQNQGK